MPGMIACVGLVCVDIVNVCRDFPIEDTDQRSQSLYWQRGGNAANTSAVLAILGSPVQFVGNIPETDKDDDLTWGLMAAKFAHDDLKRLNVDLSQINRCGCKDFPTSTVIVNQTNGSRTIMHYRGNLEELKIEDFSFDFVNYSWIHFEGRYNVEVINAAIEKINEYNQQNSGHKISISVEMEKSHIKDLISISKLTDLVFMSKEYANGLGYKTALDTVENFRKRLLPGSSIVCTWGSDGAAYATNSVHGVGKMVPGESPAKILDTIGAGDSFIAGVIHARNKGSTMQQSVEFGCRVAERKITNMGFEHIKGIKSF